jgi:hypothetical protein
MMRDALLVERPGESLAESIPTQLEILYAPNDLCG